MNIDQEYIYKLIFGKKWAELLTFVHEYSISKPSCPDELLLRAVKTFEDEFFGELDKDIKIDNIQILLEKLFCLDRGRNYKLSEDRFCRVIIKLVQIYSQQGRKEEAYKYAIQYFPKHEVCAKAINLYQDSLPKEDLLPKVLEHSQDNQIRVTENRNISISNHTISLFKSNQEMQFFMGVRAVFETFAVYPNVSLSCVIDFEKIKNDLSPEERSFFFRGIIDCVVFDQHNRYKPIKFFELDSIYHDLSEQQKKDRYKDNILSLAGQKLYRIRKISDDQGTAEFTKMIREIVE